MHEKLQKVYFSIVSSLIIGGLIIAIIVTASNIKDVGTDGDTALSTDSGLMTFLVGDGLCDDVTNTNVFEFDGGDCCGSCIVKNHCLECTCLQSDVDEYNVTNPLVGDGYCNDETNNPNCNFDGGDCCGPCLNKEFCSECLCHLGNLC